MNLILHVMDKLTRSGRLENLGLHAANSVFVFVDLKEVFCILARMKILNYSLLIGT